MCKGLIPENEFLTKETAHGLRITLTSTLNLCDYLIKKYDFKYLLTGKVNQDNLEVTFLYLYCYCKLFINQKIIYLQFINKYFHTNFLALFGGSGQ